VVLTSMPNSLPTNGAGDTGLGLSTLRDQSVLNMPPTNINPQTGLKTTRPAWNTEGLGNPCPAAGGRTGDDVLRRIRNRAPLKLNTLMFVASDHQKRRPSSPTGPISTCFTGCEFRHANVAANNTGVESIVLPSREYAGTDMSRRGSGIDSNSQFPIGGSTSFGMRAG